MLLLQQRRAAKSVGQIEGSSVWLVAVDAKRFVVTSSSTIEIGGVTIDIAEMPDRVREFERNGLLPQDGDRFLVGRDSAVSAGLGSLYLAQVSKGFRSSQIVSIAS